MLGSAVEDVIGHLKQADRDDQRVGFDDFGLDDLIAPPLEEDRPSGQAEVPSAHPPEQVLR